MFLFLSKLLPLFIYPLGLACLLMIAALVLLWKRPRWAAGAISLALFILLLSSNSWVTFVLTRSLEWQNLHASQVPEVEAIVVLGGAIKPAIPPRPWVETSDAGDRVLYAAKLYNEGKAPIVILSGGRVKWKGSGPPESGDMATILQAMGVPSKAIVEDPDSLNTYQNATNVRKLLEERGIAGPVLLVTSAFHMPRSLLVFKRQGIEAIPAPTDFLVTEQELNELQGSWQSLLLNLLPDSYNLRKTTQVLKEYIGMLVYHLRGWI